MCCFRWSWYLVCELGGARATGFKIQWTKEQMGGELCIETLVSRIVSSLDGGTRRLFRLRFLTEYERFKA